MKYLLLIIPLVIGCYWLYRRANKKLSDKELNDKYDDL